MFTLFHVGSIITKPNFKRFAAVIVSRFFPQKNENMIQQSKEVCYYLARY